MKRREFITLIGGGAVTWPLAARAQQTTMPVVGFLSGRSLAYDSRLVAAFHQGLKEVGFVEGQNVAIEFRWAEGNLIGSRRSRPIWLAKRLGRPPIAPALEKRIREALATPGRPGIKFMPSGSASIHRQCSASAALSTA